MLVRGRFAQQPLARGIFLERHFPPQLGSRTARGCVPSRGDPTQATSLRKGSRAGKDNQGKWPGTSPLVTWATAWWPRASPTSNECARCLAVAPEAAPVTRSLRSCHKNRRSLSPTALRNC